MAYTNVSAGRTWPSASGGNTALVLEAVEVRGEVIEMWVARDGDGPSCLLSPRAAREIAAELIARADFIDPRGADRTRAANTITGAVHGTVIQGHTINGVTL